MGEGKGERKQRASANSGKFEGLVEGGHERQEKESDETSAGNYKRRRKQREGFIIIIIIIIELPLVF